MRKLGWLTVGMGLALAVGACNAKRPSLLTVRPGGASATAPSPSPSASPLRFLVTAPDALGRSGASALANEATIPLFSGASILTDAGSGRRVFAIAPGNDPRTTDALPVGGAQVRLASLNGVPIGEVATADAQGIAQLPAPLPGQLRVALAAFQMGGKRYRLAVLLGRDAMPTGTVAVDPINTMIEAWVRATLAGGGQATPLDLARLKRAWTICAKAGVGVPPGELEAAKDQATATAALVARWKQVLASGVADPAEAAELQAFAAAVKGDAAASPDAAASGDVAASGDASASGDAAASR